MNPTSPHPCASPPPPRHRLTRALLLAVLGSVSLSMTSAGPPLQAGMPKPRPAAEASAAAAAAVAAAAAASSAMAEAAVLRAALVEPTRPAAIAASAASAVQAIVESALLQAQRAATGPSLPSIATTITITTSQLTPPAPPAPQLPVASAPPPPAPQLPTASAPPPPAPQLPVASAPPVPASGAPCLRAAGQNAGCGPALQLVFKTVVLPAGRQGLPYLPRLMANGGALPYSFAVTAGQLPDGLSLADDGSLRGVPSAAGGHSFTLQLSDASTPALSVRQRYSLRVDAPATPRPPAPAASKAPVPSPTPAPVTVPRDWIDNPSLSADRPGVMTWKLAQADVAALAEEASKKVKTEEDEKAKQQAETKGQAFFVDAELSDTAKAAGAKDTTKLDRLLGPVLDIEYPSRDSFLAALAARQQALCMEAVKEALKGDSQNTAKSVCKPPPGPAKPAASGANLAVDQAYEALLPAELRQALVTKAGQFHALETAQPVRWTGAGCGCGPAQPEHQVYGIVPFWQQAVKDKPQQIDFSAYTRIGYLGAIVRDDGTLATSPSWNDPSEDGLRAALRHGTGLDLVLYRHATASLLARTDAELAVVAEQAARAVVALIDTPLDGWFSRNKRFLLPFWPQPTQLYSGLTVFFDAAPGIDGNPGKAAAPANLRRFLRRFMAELIANMERSGRQYRLNIVVPDQALWLPDSAYSVEELLGYLKATRPEFSGLAISAPGAVGGAAAPQALPSGRITTQLLVLLREPITDSKKDLRARLDHVDNLEGSRRVAFLSNVIPLMLYPVGKAPQELPVQQGVQFDADLAYHAWQYGGAGLWPLPAASAGASDTVQQLLLRNFRDKTPWWTSQPGVQRSACAWVCPNRTPIRLVFEGLLILGLVACGLYLGSCRVRQLGRAYLGCLGMVGVVTFVVGLSLLTCDPDLEEIRNGNWPLFALGTVVLVLLLFYAFKPRVTPP